MEKISFDDFLKVEIRTGTIISARMNPKAKKPAYILEIDFGELGIKISSAQITQNYSLEVLAGKQITAVVNFPEKNIAGVKSEVLVLGAVSPTQDIVLLEPTFSVENGTRIA